MTSSVKTDKSANSIWRHLYLLLGVAAAVVLGISGIQFFEWKTRSTSQNNLVEYHIGTILGIDRIKSELMELRFRSHTDRRGQSLSIDPAALPKIKNIVRYNFREIVRKQKLFNESSFSAVLDRAERINLEMLRTLDDPDVNEEILSTKILFSIEALNQLARLHLLAYQTKMDSIAADNLSFEKHLLFFLGMVILASGLIVFILVRKIGAALGRQTEAELNLVQLNESLENTILVRTSEIRSAKEEAEKANETKTRFLAAASHDLRQPVQAMTILCYALKSKLRDDNVRHLVEELEANTDVLIDLLTELLDISRLDAGVLTPHIQAVPLADILGSIERNHVSEARHKGIDLRVISSTAVVRTDRVFLIRILQNIVANAVSYTDKGKIRIGCRHKGANLRIDVYDTGKGISVHHRDKIFEEFYQVDNPARNRRQGMGLGLAIVQRLTKSLGHTLEVSSEPGKGSRFSVTVPVEPAQPESHHGTSCKDSPTRIEEQCLQS